MEFAVARRKQPPVGEGQQVPHFTQVFPGLDVKARAAIEQQFVDGRHRRSAAAFAVVGQLIVAHLSRRPIVTGGDGTSARNQQLLTVDHQRTLRCDAGERIAVVRLLDVLRAVAIVRPTDCAGLRVERVQKDPHERPNAGGEVQRAVGDHRRSARGPGGNETLVAQNFLIRRAAAKPPDELTAVRPQAIDMSIVGREVELVLPRQRSKPHRSVREVTPDFVAGASVVGGDAVVEG